MGSRISSPTEMKFGSPGQSKPKDYVNKEYEYSFNGIINSPFLKKVNREESPSLVWIEKRRILLGSGTFLQAFREILLFQELKSKHRAKHIRDYVETLKDKPSVVKSIDDLDPAENHSTVTDEAFCRYRLCGPNPTSITLCTKKQLYKLELGENAELLDLLGKKHLFVVDYSTLADLPPSTAADLPKSTYGSRALFKMIEDGNNTYQLEVVCIQIIGKSKISKIVYSQARDVRWKIAKCIFQSNDGVFHEVCSHLACTHLVQEVVLVATHRLLPKGHPVLVLLKPHFEGTAWINNLAKQVLINDGGLVDALVSPNIVQVRDMVVESIRDFTSTDMTFPARIQARHMDGCPQLDYPYRDDGMLLWNAILKWTQDYLKVFYQDGQQVLDDRFIAAWLRELKSSQGGNIAWIDSLIFDAENALTSLTSFVASVIFIGSVEHAAVGFPQRPFMQFTGAFPLAIYATEDVVFKEDPTEEDYMELFPPMGIARKQAAFAQLLGGIYYTTLGFYDVDRSENSIGNYFVHHVDKSYGDRHLVKPILKAFQDELKKISEEIKNRNMKRKNHYVELLPSIIPQSINI